MHKLGFPNSLDKQDKVVPTHYSCNKIGKEKCFADWLKFLFLECVSDFDDTDQTGSFPVTPGEKLLSLV